MPYPLSTNPTQIVSPVVIQYAPDATIGLTTDAQESVTVDGIVNTFTYTLADATAARAFLNGFNLAGLRYDEVNGEVDEDLSALNLQVTGGLATYVEAAVDTATSATSENKTLKEWLDAELRAAFVAAFPTYLSTPDAAAAVADGANDSGNGVGSAAAQSAVSGVPLPPGGTAQDAVDATNLATIIRNTIINSFTVNVDVSSAAASSDFTAQFNGEAPLLRRSLYRQIAKDSWMQYYTMGDPAGGIGPGLPLLGGDKLVFVFDVDVNATTGGADSGAPTPETANTILLNLGNRRVAFEFVMPGSGIIPHA
jgi:hypothetical protein